ncbi:hypothetical protein LTR99_010410 [Exophiala xenobiotica]|uniref:Uncharacterized protein n=1 Tax=Vermiconidia calcicola TaxID=1690605 RepID=A0AAV9Q254_9PEZI|nr:hypothetical protein LTS06_010176 [Exophiala xenobiotica]KAK5530273.1 hypothetical protein LTR23_010431 [Chaetothyriales sp. CCFEE 6169]KAK5534127.1 hypothetical protein LTR25_007107 [Vermiconidia calcicola]KAK5264120.1 hypothetical protein LTR96_010628 [Exophiala xenobiotica]KAK5282634.1 hypothetical protein LTR40_003030 [Exophiala xenobiotica]
MKIVIVRVLRFNPEASIAPAIKATPSLTTTSAQEEQAMSPKESAQTLEQSFLDPKPCGQARSVMPYSVRWRQQSGLKKTSEYTTVGTYQSFIVIADFPSHELQNEASRQKHGLGGSQIHKPQAKDGLNQSDSEVEGSAAQIDAGRYWMLFHLVAP